MTAIASCECRHPVPTDTHEVARVTFSVGDPRPTYAILYKCGACDGLEFYRHPGRPHIWECDNHLIATVKVARLDHQVRCSK